MTKVNRNAAVIDSGNWIILKAATMISSVTPPTRHSVSSEGVIIFFIFLFFLYKLITFKPVQSYNVKHLTCTISCSSGLQNIYKLHIWKCSTFTIFTLLHLFTNNKKGYYIYKQTKKSSSGHLVMRGLLLLMWIVLSSGFLFCTYTDENTRVKLYA